MQKGNAPVAWRPIAVEFDGKRHAGKYFVEHQMVTVHATRGGTRSAAIADHDPVALAKSLLAEMIAAKRTPGA